MMSKIHLAKSLLGILIGGCIAALWVVQGTAQAETIIVYRNPQCGCCERWATLMRDHGFTVHVQDVAGVDAIAAAHGVPPALRACHTALVGGYVIEGHVPADQIERLLRDRPRIKGIAVPGMPQGSPGMEGPNPQHYDVMSFDANGDARVYDRR